MPRNEESSILVIGAHPDDECLGAGGTIRKHVEFGIPVDVLSLTSSSRRSVELEKACSILGVRNVYWFERGDFEVGESLIKDITEVILKARPIIVITHSPLDYNRNHVTCSRLVDEAVEWASHVTIYDNAHRVERIYHMEVNSLHSYPQIMVDISKTYKTANDALKAHHSQTGKAEGFYFRLYDARTKLRGVQANCERAEAFTIKYPEHAGPFYPENSVQRLI